MIKDWIVSRTEIERKRERKKIQAKLIFLYSVENLAVLMKILSINDDRSIDRFDDYWNDDQIKIINNDKQQKKMITNKLIAINRFW